jgi:uncharacterized protein YfaT (DUF1175 family)
VVSNILIAILILKSTNQKFSSLDNPTLEGYITQGGLEERLECFNSFFFRSWSLRVGLRTIKDSDSKVLLKQDCEREFMKVV